MEPMPDLPCLSAAQNSSVVLPTGVSAPRPVRTTRRGCTSYEFSLMYWMASPTVTIFSASSSGIWMSKCSSRAMTSSTVSRESAPRSSMNFLVGSTSSSSTPSCSTMISFTFSSTDFAMNPSPPEEVFLHVQAAVDVEDLACYVGRPVTGEESYHLGHFASRPDPLERYLRQQRLSRLGRDSRRHVGLDEPGRHRVHEDVPVRQLPRGRFGQPDQPRFRRRVVDLAGVTHDAGGGGVVDDAPAVLQPDHQLGRCPAHQERAAQVGLHDAVPVVVFHADQQPVPRDPGVVHEDVEPPEPVLGRLHEPVGVVAPGRVGHDAVYGGAALFERLDGVLQ